MTTSREGVSLVVVIAALSLGFGLMSDSFLTPASFSTIANQLPTALTIAVAMTFVLVVGEIDLSVGSVLALSQAVLGVTMVQLGWSWPLAITAALATGLVAGLVNGLIVVRWALPSFIVTLGMMEAARGGAYLVSGSRTQYIGTDIEWIAAASWLGLSVPFIVAMLLVLAGHTVLSRTVFGRYATATGTNQEAVRLAGIDTNRIKLTTFALSGLLAALAGVMQVSRLASADPNAGTGFELDAIAAAVIGGTRLMGGKGSILNTFLGVVIISVLASGLTQIGVQDPAKRLVTGCVIVLAVIADVYRQRWATRRRAEEPAVMR
jgi:ribose transport system permease protein